MVVKHDFKKFPELANSQVDFYYWDSPHKQIFEDFSCVVEKVTDGDTIRVSTNFRDFNFPIRILDIDAPEIGKPNARIAQRHLERVVLKKKVEILINRKNRVDKYGRLLGKVIANGQDMGEEMLGLGLVTSFENRREGEISIFKVGT